jgi:hypothetical protein
MPPPAKTSGQSAGFRPDRGKFPAMSARHFPSGPWTGFFTYRHAGGK